MPTKPPLLRMNAMKATGRPVPRRAVGRGCPAAGTSPRWRCRHLALHVDGRIEAHPKHGRAHNKLTGFRYQAALRIGAGREEPVQDGVLG
jgi:hypothetical protein